jgi:hypothetical protein
VRVVGTVLRAGLAAVLCAGVLAGCSEEPAPKPEKETPKLSEARFLERGNEICARAARDLDRRAGDLDTSTPARARQTVREVIVPEIRGQVSAVRALRGPARLERRLDPVLDESERLLDFIYEDPARYADAELLFVSVNQDLAAIGLTECAK